VAVLAQPAYDGPIDALIGQKLHVPVD
jgi:hypothetical protein